MCKICMKFPISAKIVAHRENHWVAGIFFLEGAEYC